MNEFWFGMSKNNDVKLKLEKINSIYRMVNGRYCHQSWVQLYVILILLSSCFGFLEIFYFSYLGSTDLDLEEETSFLTRHVDWFDIL